MNEYSVKQIIKSLMIVLVVILIFYFLTTVIIDDTNDKQSVNEIQYNEIRVSSLYNIVDEEYYVLVQLDADVDDLAESLLSLSNNIEENVYTANLDNAYNKKYYSDVSNFEEILPIFSQSTLLKIQNNEITEIKEGVSLINIYIEDITGESNE